MNTWRLTGFVAVFCSLCVSSLLGTETTKRLKKSEILTNIVRLAQDTYDDLKTTPPLYDENYPATIQVVMYVSSIDAVNEASMDFTMGILLHLKWLDPRIHHPKAILYFKESGLDYLDFDTENIKKVWLPDIFFPDEKKGSFHDIMTRNQMMRLYKDGYILYISRLTLTLSCTMDLLNYPFDKQKCHVALMSFAYSDTDIEFKWINTSEAQSMQMFGNSEPIVWNDAVILPQFEVKKIFPGSCERRYHQKSGNHSCIQAGIHLTRNVGFYIVQMYIPSMLIVMLSWISFWLNSNSVPGRVSLGLLTVLTMTTQSSSVNAALPRVSYTKAIDVWMSTCLVFVFAALLEFAVVNVLSRKESIRGFSFRNMFAIPKDDEKEEGPPAMCEMTVPLDGFKDPDTQKKRRFPKKGIVYAVYVDVMARFFFPVCFILFIIVYWCVYGSQVDD